jgi:hypothetical protein
VSRAGGIGGRQGELMALGKSDGTVAVVAVVGKMSSTDCRGSENAGEKATKNIVNISPSKRFCTLISSEGGPISIPLWLLLL